MPRPTDPVTERVRDTADGLNALLAEAASARAARAEVTQGEAGADDRAAPAGTGPDGTASGTSAVCAWNHFENIPTFYNWNNRPR